MMLGPHLVISLFFFIDLYLLQIIELFITFQTSHDDTGSKVN